MHRFVSQNTEIIPVSEGVFPANSSAALYGKGVFTTLAVSNSKPFMWSRHWQRLLQNAATVGIDTSNVLENVVAASLTELIEKNSAFEARARITIFDTAESLIWNASKKSDTSVFIQTADLRSVPESLLLTISPFSVNSASILVRVKSCNYLENILAFENAKAKGFDEAVRLNEKGNVASACLSNIFWVKRGKLLTPDLDSGCLPGTTRELVIGLAREDGIEVLETAAPLPELMDSDEVFLTSAGLSVAFVGNIEGKSFDLQYSANLKAKLADLKNHLFQS